MKDLGYGIIVFEKSIKPNNEILSFLDKICDQELEDSYYLEVSQEKQTSYLINKSGHRFLQEDIDKNCIRLSEYFKYPDSQEAVNFFKECDKQTYQLLLQYIEKYPMLLPCIWWKTKGHPLVYRSGSSQGLHSDNDINFIPGFEPAMQLGIRHVLASITYLNDDYVGGEIVFPYPGIKYKPATGDTILFPSNFLCAHSVNEVEDGTRYAYLQYFGQGSSDEQYGISINEDNENVFSGQVWLYNIHDDYYKFITSKYSESNSGEFLLPLQRTIHSKREL